MILLKCHAKRNPFLLAGMLIHLVVKSSKLFGNGDIVLLLLKVNGGASQDLLAPDLPCYCN